MVSKSDDDLKIMLNRITLRPNAGVCAGISIPRSLGALEGQCRWEREAKDPPGIPAPALESPCSSGAPRGVEAAHPA